MNTLKRMGVFNLVGAMGAGVQLLTVVLFEHALGNHYILVSIAALEITLCHNFVWHWKYTWRDRRHGHAALNHFLRFHLSNGMVSLLANLTLIPVLTERAHLSLAAAAACGILGCSLLNYVLSDRWAFGNAPCTAPPQNLASDSLHN